MSDSEIRVGALLEAARLDASGLARAMALGLESWSLSFWEELGEADLGELAGTLTAELGRPPEALSIYGNTLEPGERGERLRSGLRDLLESAPRFGARMVSAFAGRIPGASVPDSIEAWKACFGPLCERAAALGVSVALESCRLGDTWKTGKWNIAIGPDAWELLFAALPGAPLGLEWEPAHQILAFADPLVQLELWIGKVLHVHAKDARLDRRLLAERGIHGTAKPGRECLAGEGDTDWTALFELLRRSGYRGTVDAEIGSTPGWEGERHFEGLERALGALRDARAGGRSAGGPEAPRPRKAPR